MRTPSLGGIEFLVQMLSSPFNAQTEQNDAAASKEDETTSHSIEWLLARREEVWTEPMRALRDAIGDGDTED